MFRMKKPICQLGKLFSLLTFYCLVACSNDAVEPAAQNIFEGEISETEFKADILSTTRIDDVYTIIGNVNNDANFQLYFNGSDLIDYPISSDGAFVQAFELLGQFSDSITDQINNPDFNADSAIVDLSEFFTAQIDSIFADTTQPVLNENEAFMFYLIGANIYFSNAGSVTLSAFDEELDRISGSFDISLENLPGGQKQLKGIFEDIQFLSE